MYSAAAHLVASVVGNINRWMYACPGERVANGVPLIDWMGDPVNTVVFYTRPLRRGHTETAGTGYESGTGG